MSVEAVLAVWSHLYHFIVIISMFGASAGQGLCMYSSVFSQETLLLVAVYM